MSDIYDEATELRERIAELEDAIRGIRDNWESGDLDGAVRSACSLIEDEAVEDDGLEYCPEHGAFSGDEGECPDCRIVHELQIKANESDMRA